MRLKDFFRKSIEKRKSTKELVSSVDLLTIMIIGLLMGTVFIFGMNYWESPVKRSDAISISATFRSYQADWVEKSTSDITIYFSDTDQMTIDGTCVTDELLNQLDRIESGTVLQVVKHPNSDTILEIVKGGEIIVDFDVTQKNLREEVMAFTIMGAVFYTFSFFAAVVLILRYLKKIRNKRMIRDDVEDKS
jgi:hypothetical protein